jgi:hypothetical protein
MNLINEVNVERLNYFLTPSRGDFGNEIRDRASVSRSDSLFKRTNLFLEIIFFFHPVVCVIVNHEVVAVFVITVACGGWGQYGLLILHS